MEVLLSFSTESRTSIARYSPNFSEHSHEQPDLGSLCSERGLDYMAFQDPSSLKWQKPSMHKLEVGI